MRWLLTAAGAGPADPAVLEALVAALWERYLATGSAGDRRAVISWGELLLALPGDTARDGDVHETVGLALLDEAGEPEPEPGPHLAAAIGHLESALAALPPADPGRGGLAALLAFACWRQLAGDSSRYAEVDRMTRYAAEAWALLPAGDEARPEIGLYLASGIHERLLRPGVPFEPAAASLAIGALTEIEPHWAGEEDLHPLVVTNLGHFLAARGQATGSAADVAAAGPWLELAMAEVPLSDPAWAEVTQTLAAAMTVLATLGMSTAHLDRAIGLLTVVAGRAGGDLQRLVRTREALGVLLIQRAQFSGHPEDLTAGIGQLRTAWEMSAPGGEDRIAIALNLGSALLTRFLLGSDAQDLDAAEFYLDMARELARGRPGLRQLMADTDLVITATTALLRLGRGLTGERAGFGEAVEGLRTALAMLPPGHPYAARLRSDLGLALAARAGHEGGSQDGLREAMAELRTAAAGMPADHLMWPNTLLRITGTLAAAAAASGDPDQLAEAARAVTGALPSVDPRFAEGYRFLLTAGNIYLTRYRVTRERTDLDAALHWLEEGHREVAGRPGSAQLTEAFTLLAQCHRLRGRAAASRRAGLAALRELGRQVLLQTGSTRGLRLARAAAAQSAEVAGWCLQDDRPQTAVTAIELGRGLILWAATAVTSLPEMLTGAGHGDLAAEWLAALESHQEPPWDAGPAGAAHGEGLLAAAGQLPVPDELRSRVLTALAGQGTERLLAPPSAAEIGTALAETGADVLAYLVPPGTGQAGCALLVPAAGRGQQVMVLSLPLLRRPGDVPAGGEPVQVCAWAYQAVISPLLAQVRGWGLAGLPRLVLVPIGPLAAIPWHAAWRPASGGGRYACTEAVISYAASGRQLIDVSLRPALAPQSSAVIVGNPAFDLPFAGLEARAIRDGCYPAARYFGHATPGWVRADGPGSAVEVLGQLPAAAGAAGASVLHLGCHAATVAAAPGRSYLSLADGQQLTVEEILRRANGRPPRAPGGLVSLAACHSDESGQDQDEALTLATAFLAAGAVTVVGSRWEVPDDATSLLMFMFHHYLTTGGQSPRDALRLAQLWMIDPGRVPPPQMPEALAKDARYPGHAELSQWAAFTHQGR